MKSKLEQYCVSNRWDSERIESLFCCMEDAVRIPYVEVKIDILTEMQSYDYIRKFLQQIAYIKGNCYLKNGFLIDRKKC